MREGPIVGLAGSFGPLRTSAASFLANQTGPEQFGDFFFHKLRLDRQLRGEPFAHFLAHEHGVGADVNDAALFEHSIHERFDLRINQRLAAANGNHGRVAFLGRAEAILQRQDVLERSGIFANPSATGAGQVAGVQRLQLQARWRTSSCRAVSARSCTPRSWSSARGEIS